MVDNAVVMEALMAQLDDPSLQHTGKRALEGGEGSDRNRNAKRRRRGQKVSPVA
jgi:hypothetical protein